MAMRIDANLQVHPLDMRSNVKDCKQDLSTEYALRQQKWNTKPYIGFLLRNPHLVLTYPRDHCRGHAHFNCEYLGNGDK